MNSIDISVAIDCQDWHIALPEAEERAIAAAMAALQAGGGHVRADMVELSVVLADDDTVRDLNARFRGKDAPTNVLSFAALDDEDAPRPEGAPLLLGDVVLAYETCDREASEQNKSLSDHYTHLVVHGVLHLLGHDHEDDGEAGEMEALETSILAGLGVPDPYAEGGR